jgi:3',5'-cyclic AMP phosphodiesterase CpdA
MPETLLFHFSDVHFGIEDRAALAWFADAVARDRPDAAICTGDLTQRARHGQYEAARAWFAGLGVPVLLEPGNHDMPYFNPVERFRTPFARYERLARAVVYAPDLPDIAVVSLRTTVSAQWRWPWSDGVVRDEALAQALADLRRVEGDGRLKLVTCHHPLVGREFGGRNRTIGGTEALAALAAAGADVILSGHIHIPFDITHRIEGRQVRTIGSGTLSHRLRGAPPSYNVLRYNPDEGLAVENRRFEGA